MSDARSLITAGAARLARAGVPSAQADAVLLLAHAWTREPGDIRHAMALRHEVPHDVSERFGELMEQREQRIPVQHLTGTAAFRHLELQVGPGVFVPRPETELLVDLVLPALPESGVLVDLCTGSGAIAFSVKQERPDATVLAVEVSALAVAWATRNRDALGLDVQVVHGSAQSALPEWDGVVDVVASNPPYVPQDMVPVEPEVRDHDPELALYGGSLDGLAVPLEVADRGGSLLRSGGLLAMEHAEQQAQTLPRRLLRDGRWDQVEDHLDLTGRPRVVTARRR